MNCYELIKANQSLLQVLKNNKISVNDIDSLQIYEEFRAMKKHSHKTIYCVSVLADKYGRSQPTISSTISAVMWKYKGPAAIRRPSIRSILLSEVLGERSLRICPYRILDKG